MFYTYFSEKIDKVGQKLQNVLTAMNLFKLAVKPAPKFGGAGYPANEFIKTQI